MTRHARDIIAAAVLILSLLAFAILQGVASGAVGTRLWIPGRAATQPSLRVGVLAWEPVPTTGPVEVWEVNVRFDR